MRLAGRSNWSHMSLDCCVVVCEKINNKKRVLLKIIQQAKVTESGGVWLVGGGGLVWSGSWVD